MPDELWWQNAIFLPKGAPAEMVNKLNRATVEAMESPNVSERLYREGIPWKRAEAHEDQWKVLPD
jgi:tripartite-type tricarboxylate transporter receptor subunit TctC